MTLGNYFLQDPILIQTTNLTVIGIDVQFDLHSIQEPIFTIQNSFNVEFQGITFSNGTNYATGSGAMQIINSTRIAFHRVTFSSNVGIVGGSLSIRDSNNVTFDSCEFTGNRAIFKNFFLENTQEYMHKVKSTFYHNVNFLKNVPASTALLNQTTGLGGVAYIHHSHGVRFQDCTFSENYAFEGAAILAVRSSIDIAFSIFERNTALSQGR